MKWSGMDSTGQFCIDPESLPILEPMTGDLLSVRLSSPAYSGPLATDYFVLGCPWDEVEFEVEYESHRIIQRNCKPFHWPDCKEE